MGKEPERRRFAAGGTGKQGAAGRDIFVAALARLGGQCAGTFHQRSPAVVMPLKAAAKAGVVRAIAEVAPLTWRLRRPGSLVVLMYHRVLPADAAAREMEQPGMYVSPETLDLHLAELRRHFELVHLDDWLRQARQGEALPHLACAITFDDGWRDNYQYALPVLARHGAPATIFLVASYVGTAKRFWPNRLTQLILEEWARPGSVRFPEELGTIVGPKMAEGRRRKSIDIADVDLIIQQALQLDEDRIRALVLAAEERGATSATERDTLDAAEIAAMVKTGLIRFGSHSATHHRLAGETSPERLVVEIAESQARLREICNQPVDLFCYPNGVTSAAAIELVRRHYLGAVITETGWHRAHSDAHLIRRIRVHEDISRDRYGFLERLSGWL